jgi:eukaryotic-like serine/threonine-protein kinase
MDLLLTTPIGPGDLLDQYRIEGLVATGGMASVFRAIDTRTGRVVAVKVPHPDAANDPVFLERFHYASELGRRLDHPGLVKVLAQGANGHYAVMEWVEGQTLREIIDEHGTLPPERAIRIAISICGALEHIHSHGIVHHDLKPDNVIVNAEGNIKLIDFGIAGQARPDAWRSAKPSDSMGTPDYAAPEQISGNRGDARSDIYSLGIILYEMLTGEVPFSGLDPSTAMNLRSLVDPPCPREINPAISPRLRDFIQRAIARRQAKRFATAREFASNLVKLLAEARAVLPPQSLAGV